MRCTIYWHMILWGGVVESPSQCLSKQHYSHFVHFLLFTLNYSRIALRFTSCNLQPSRCKNVLSTISCILEEHQLLTTAVKLKAVVSLLCHTKLKKHSRKPEQFRRRWLTAHQIICVVNQADQIKNHCLETTPVPLPLDCWELKYWLGASTKYSFSVQYCSIKARIYSVAAANMKIKMWR